MTKIKIKINGKIPSEWDGKVSKCKGCNENIGWAITERGKKMPFDLNDEKHTAHWATCPKQHLFRKKKL